MVVTKKAAVVTIVGWPVTTPRELVRETSLKVMVGLAVDEGSLVLLISLSAYST